MRMIKVSAQHVILRDALRHSTCEKTRCAGHMLTSAVHEAVLARNYIPKANTRAVTVLASDQKRLRAGVVRLLKQALARAGQRGRPRGRTWARAGRVEWPLHGAIYVLSQLALQAGQPTSHVLQCAQCPASVLTDRSGSCVCSSGT